MIVKFLKGTLLLILMLFITACAHNDRLRNKELSVEKSVLNAKSSQIRDIDSAQQDEKNAVDFNTTEVSDLGGITKLQEEAQKAPNLEGEPISFTADEIPLKEFTSRVFDELLGINYVISPKLAASKDTVTLNISNAIPRDEFYKVVIKTLEESSIRVLRKDKILYLSQVSSGERKNSIAIGIGIKEDDIPQVSGEITQIVPYVYSGSRNLSSIMGKLSTAKVTINSMQKLITLEGDRSEIVRAIKIINMLDVPRAYGREIRLVEFANISPVEGMEQIKKLIEQDGMEVSNEGDVSFVPIPRINSLVAYAASEKLIDRITFWANKIDVPIAGDERQYFVYKPKYAKAKEMMESITSLLSGANTNSNTGNSDNKSSKGTTSVDGPIKYSLDKQQNSLIFYTGSDQYRLINSLLKKMDILPGQVILDVSILEVTLSDDMSSGIDWLYRNTGISADGSSQVSASLNGAGSLVAQAISGNWQGRLNWSDTQSNARVLSRPYLIVRDGESASITSGDQVPIITQTVEDVGNNSSVSNSVQYRSTGVNVSITPTINSQGVISLTVDMSVSNAKPNDLGGTSSPTITNRAISTKVLSADGQTIALGGLIQQTKANDDNGVPGLSDLPLLGNLFKSKSDQYSRTELVMLITSKVVKNSTDVDEFSEAMSELYSAPITIK